MASRQKPEPDLSRWDLWTVIAVLTEARHHPFWETRVDEVRARLEAGADPDAGRTPPLVLAASMGHLPICEVLLEFGADVHGGRRFATPLAAATDPDVKALLRRHGARDTIFTAVAERDEAGVRQRLADDPDLATAADEDGQTPLFVAAGLRDVALMTLLLEAGADPNHVAEGAYGVSPIHRTSRNASGDAATEAITLLAQHGADLDARNHGGVTALHMAVRDRDLDAVRTLLELGAEVDVEDRGRRSTPLRRAVASTGRPGTSGKQDVAVAITALLLEQGADPAHVNRSGRSLLESARHPEIRALIEKALAARRSP